SCVFCDGVFVMICSQRAKEQADGGHVLQAMVPIGWIMERTFLVDDSNRRFLGCDDDLSDFVEAVSNLRMQLNRSFDGGLSVELGRERNLKQNMFHHI